MNIKHIATSLGGLQVDQCDISLTILEFCLSLGITVPIPCNTNVVACIVSQNVPVRQANQTYHQFCGCDGDPWVHAHGDACTIFVFPGDVCRGAVIRRRRAIETELLVARSQQYIQWGTCNHSARCKTYKNSHGESTCAIHWKWKENVRYFQPQSKMVHFCELKNESAWNTDYRLWTKSACKTDRVSISISMMNKTHEIINLKAFMSQIRQICSVLLFYPVIFVLTTLALRFSETSKS